ncbi:MAG TPA: FAD/NAD(P)-binding protein, partial [Nitrospiria bacterium]|nr:FAD/NAD(P)-binding protein [Nitrospiria bacterium]
VTDSFAAASAVGVRHVEPLPNRAIPIPAVIVEKRAETRGIYTFRLRIRDEAQRAAFRFRPGQFNMLYVFGVGEIPISIASDPDDSDALDHTVRIVGNVTGVLERLSAGDAVGLRGPYGSSWPLGEAQGRDVILITGGLGCAPVVSVISYVVRRRDRYGALKILHGVKAPKDLLYRERFTAWAARPNTEVHLTTDQPDRRWRHHTGVVTGLLDNLAIAPFNSVVMMCGPEGMMRAAAAYLFNAGVPAERVYVSIERNMKCAVGLCGHCQMGSEFVCKTGPVFRYDRIRQWFEHPGV